MNLYLYDGPVMEFNNCVANRWTASTRAVSEKKARSNLTYQFKKKNNRLPGTKIILPGKISLRLKTEQRLRGYSYGIDCSGYFSENAFCA